ncbi:dephospho-CoA kinase [Candidatus Palibaumannia cicadellinicola]|uniref:Dephospho-CoA kinase n=1 Tax=Baumannia cicadellinicola subsp. Homalodisca coagulata TaxID=374463 RepID=Q1LSW9_BAUCH|nr:dephospho-CoA kinase [Candidatus Baumannia cicadellinicola]ABF14166.1 dephospho-CoA kinase [Baumannia cicadellinicola str. Hc (Homalodisca coagulata)]MBS0032556.1 dephospho-CoA kinase [Candidatus Baumannia cicadellinicola]MCJ7462194.1 dephospho-CoA kinase [Candidatus Baumannia cicadellinicola]MCJ7462970.1 dephospho-CoA kinase [Candidatus Baumannia cicadellinicola]
MSYIVAITGGIGSGKSTVANKFANLGIPIIDADVISHQIVQPGSYALNLIYQRFGPMILHNNGHLNRYALRKQIFSNLEDKVWLNNLLHPLIQLSTQQKIKAIYNYAPYIIWVVPLLIETNLQKYADRILVIDVTPEIQIARTIIRDRTNSQQVENIIAAQIQRSHRINYANDIINNSKSYKDLDITKLHNFYLRCATLKNIG